MLKLCFPSLSRVDQKDTHANANGNKGDRRVAGLDWRELGCKHEQKEIDQMGLTSHLHTRRNSVNQRPIITGARTLRGNNSGDLDKWKLTEQNPTESEKTVMFAISEYCCGHGSYGEPHLQFWQRVQKEERWWKHWKNLDWRGGKGGDGKICQ